LHYNRQQKSPLTVKVNKNKKQGEAARIYRLLNGKTPHFSISHKDIIEVEY
jgi:hypothetical protein